MSLKKLFSKILIAISMLLSSSLLFATDYYVSKTGNDLNSGTSDEPFLTIAKASSVLQAGDICYIKAGTYRETISPANAGSSGSPIIYKAYADDEVIISACEAVTSWQVHNGNIYKASVQMDLGIQFRAFFANRKVMDIARWPNNADNNKFTIDAEPVDGGSASSINRTTISSSIDWAGGYIWYLGAHCGTSWTRPVTSSSAGVVNFTAVDITKWPFNPHNPTVLRNNNRGRFYLFGKLEALDYPGEWYYDATAKVIYFMAPGGQDPNTLSTEYAAREHTALINKNYIVLDGLNFSGGRVTLIGNYCTVKNCDIENGYQGIDELDNTDAQIGFGNITVEGSYATIENNLIEYGSSNGIALTYSWKGSTNCVVRNNNIRYFNTIGNHSSPVRSGIQYLTCEKNSIYTTGRDGIYCSGTNGEIAYNDISDCMLINNDGGVFYTVGNANDKNTSIHHNWVHDSFGPAYADGRAAGIYLDNNSKGYTVHHNMIWNVTWTGIQMNWDNWNIDIFNNSIYNAGEAMGRWENGYTLQDVVLKNNYASSASWIGTDISNTTNIISAASPFTSFESRDFRPKTGSLLIDAGEIIAGITDGYQGTKPDIGAYESGAEAWIPGADWEPLVPGTPTAIDDITDKRTSLMLSPVPATTELNITSSDDIDFENALFQLYSATGSLQNLSGRVYKSQKQAKIALNGLAPGIYILKIIGKEVVSSSTFVKN